MYDIICFLFLNMLFSCFEFDENLTFVTLFTFTFLVLLFTSFMVLLLLLL